ncbi:MAG TPA: hypothetical protein PKY82_02590 [Pyrinomonadaceae bacterium]|nr:hypothetical protein [Pyrinomonadaceae bacterium]
MKTKQLEENDELNSTSKGLRLNISYDIFDWYDEDTNGITKYKIDIFREDVLAGQMTAYKFDLEAIDYVHNALDLERETAPFMELFKDNVLKQNVLKTLKRNGRKENLMILERLEILPKFRGKRFSEAIFEMIDKSIGWFCMSVMIAFPLQFENEGQETNRFGDKWGKKMKIMDFSKDEAQSFKSLTKYYESCGFRVIPNCSRNFMVRVKVPR